MNNISVDLDFIGMYNLSESEIIKRLEQLKTLNVTSFAIPYELFLNKELSAYKERLLSALSAVKFNLCLKACTIRNFSSEYVDDKNLQDSIAFHTQYIFNTYEMLKEYGLHENLKIIFEGGRHNTSNVSFILDKAITFFREISLSARKIDVQILIELLEDNIIAGRRVGDNWQDMIVLCGGIQNTNFGILWNMQNSRKNNVCKNDLLVPPDDIIDRVLLCTLTNTASYEYGTRSYNVEMQFEEIKSLIKNDYTGEFHLEFVYSDIYEKGIPYENVYESIEYLNYILVYYNNENKKHGLVINYDPERMKRRYIRRYFDDDAVVILETNNYKFTNVEMSEKFIRLTCSYEFNYKIGSKHKVVLKVKSFILELDVSLEIVRKNNELVDYVFLIENNDKKTRKNICEIVYLTA